MVAKIQSKSIKKDDEIIKVKGAGSFPRESKTVAPYSNEEHDINSLQNMSALIAEINKRNNRNIDLVRPNNLKKVGTPKVQEAGLRPKTPKSKLVSAKRDSASTGLKVDLVGRDHAFEEEASYRVTPVSSVESLVLSEDNVGPIAQTVIKPESKPQLQMPQVGVMNRISRYRIKESGDITLSSSDASILDEVDVFEQVPVSGANLPANLGNRSSTAASIRGVVHQNAKKDSYENRLTEIKEHFNNKKNIPQAKAGLTILLLDMKRNQVVNDIYYEALLLSAQTYVNSKLKHTQVDKAIKDYLEIYKQSKTNQHQVYTAQALYGLANLMERANLSSKQLNLIATEIKPLWKDTPFVSDQIFAWNSLRTLAKHSINNPNINNGYKSTGQFKVEDRYKTEELFNKSTYHYHRQNSKNRKSELKQAKAGFKEVVAQKMDHYTEASLALARLYSDKAEKHPSARHKAVKQYINALSNAAVNDDGVSVVKSIIGLTDLMNEFKLPHKSMRLINKALNVNSMKNDNLLIAFSITQKTKQPSLTPLLSSRLEVFIEETLKSSHPDQYSHFCYRLAQRYSVEAANKIKDQDHSSSAYLLGKSKELFNKSNSYTHNTGEYADRKLWIDRDRKNLGNEITYLDRYLSEKSSNKSHARAA